MSRRHPRPSSSQSQRPPSSLSSARPASSASSLRPHSRISTRPSSRLSRPATRQTTRLLPLCQSLVTQATGLSPDTDDENFRTAVDFVSKNLEHAIKAGPSADMATMDKHFRGHVLKASINSHDDLADALQAAYRKVQRQAEQLTDLDERIKLSRLPDHLQLLILLSSAPSDATHAFAETLKDARPTETTAPLTWKDILAEEPFEGQHWEGAYGLPPGSTVEGWETHSGGSTPSLSPWDEDDSLDSDDAPPSLEDLPPPLQTGHLEGSNPLHCAGREENPVELIERLKARQYWREGWKIDVDVLRPFDINDPSTLGPTMLRLLGERETLPLFGAERERYIHERDAVREVLMCLQDRKNVMIYTTPDTFSSVPSPSAPHLLHYTSAAQSSILSSFAQVTTTVCHLRKFVSAILEDVSAVDETTRSGTMRLLTHNVRSRTIEAFADAVHAQIQAFDRWCAGKEEAICRALAGCGDPLIVSLLSLEKEVRDTFSGTFDVVLDILHRLVGHICQSRSRLDEAVWNIPNMPTQFPPAVVSAVLLDLLLQESEEQWYMGNLYASNSLAAIFATTSEPLWSMIKKWLKDGIPVRNAWDLQNDIQALDEEFFIEDNELPLMDPDLWADGYVLRNPVVLECGEKTQVAVPAFLGPVVDQILGAGKAVGLLRMMGIHFFSESATGELLDWKTFTRLFESGAASLRDSESLSHLVSEELSAYCLAAGLRLSRVLTEECELLRHLAAVEGLYLMTRGDVISNFADVIFAKMDSQQSWNDFHFLNGAFRDIVESTNSEWIDTTLVRLSYRGAKAADTLNAIDRLVVEYAAPFPLTYIFTPGILKSYCSLFVFLLQVRRAKCVLERILLRSAVSNVGLRSELKVLYAMRGKLSWFINALFNFLTTNVIHVQVVKLKSALKEARSLDEMIRLHNDHVETLLCKCFLDSTTSSLSKAILSILDMCVRFRTFFTMFAGDATHDVSRLSFGGGVRRHRSRRQRRLRKDVIGFSVPLPSDTEDEDEDEDEDEGDEFGADPDEDGDGAIGGGKVLETPSRSSISYVAADSEEDVSAGLERMSSELDGLVRYVRRGAESMAARARGSSESESTGGSAFGVFAFALEDWDA